MRSRRPPRVLPLLAKKTSSQSHISCSSRVGLLTWHLRARATRAATHLEPAIHPHLHDRLRLAQLGVRHPHLPYPPHGIPRQRHPVRGCWFIELAVTALAATLVLRVLMTGLLGTPYNMNQASYDLARLSGNGRSSGSRAAKLYVLTCDGLRFANVNSRRWGS